MWRILLVAFLAAPVLADDKPQQPATKEEVAALRASVKELREQLAELRARVDALIDAVNGRPEPAAKAQAQDDEIALGLKRHYPVVGMTLEQVQKALPGLKCRTTSTTATSDVTEWGVASTNADEFIWIDYTIVFHDGKAYRIRTHDKPPGNTTGIAPRRGTR